MKFIAKTEDELGGISLILPGIYVFQVKDAEDCISKNGNEMIKIMLTIWDAHGNVHPLQDYLLEAMPKKLKHFADASGLIDKYNSGEIKASDCIMKGGCLELIIEKGKEKPSGGYYWDKNSIKDYIKRKDDNTKSQNGYDQLDDEIPF